MKLILISSLLLSMAACAPQISEERAAQRAEQDRLNNERYLEQKYYEEFHYYNEQGIEIDVD